MAGLQGCRVFKIEGVRKLIAKYAPDQSFTRSGAVNVVPHVDDAAIDADAQTRAALLALARLLARQAAREVFAGTATDSDRSFDEGRE